MQRIFGVGKKKAPAPSIADTSAVLEKRGESLESKIAKLEKELIGYKEQMAKVRPGPAQNRIKQKALHVLKQKKKMYEQQRDALGNQQFNLDQLQFTTETTRATIDQVACMKDAAKVLKRDMKQMKIEEIDALQDELADIYEDSQEIQEIMGRCYGVPDGIDEDDLEAELATLGDGIGDASYLDEAITTPSGPVGPPTRVGGETETDPARLEQQLGL
eukprot:NODE_7077_length_813_cov_25.576812_g6472_i0.p1 GENE.NODE_7077_length_813_cov_25.576812_g6472_i0~~NODE_7077_length_813_cov_25.576812_g6472_i0.p1  ORF type:complete len:217 (-),score=51.77 NODE_7077_length_813_cov_25.576812_g6472_i0:124-774(-)